MIDAQMDSLDPAYVVYDDVEKFLHDYSNREVHSAARSVWRSLVVFFPGQLVVECALCNQPYGTCICEMQGRSVGDKQVYYVAGNARHCMLAAIKHWRIARAGIKALNLEDVRHNTDIHTRGKWLVLAFVEWVQQR